MEEERITVKMVSIIYRSIPRKERDKVASRLGVVSGIFGPTPSALSAEAPTYLIEYATLHTQTHTCVGLHALRKSIQMIDKVFTLAHTRKKDQTG